MTANLYLPPSCWAFGRAYDSWCEPLVRRLHLGPVTLTWWSSTECLTPPERRARRVLWTRRALAGAVLAVAVAAIVGAGLS